MIELDPTQGQRDSFDRLLAYVWLEDGRNFNYLAIEEGFGKEFTFNEPYGFRLVFMEAQRRAQPAEAGLWAAETCGGDTTQPVATPEPDPTEAPPPPEPAACEPSYPGVCIPPFPPDLDCGDVSARRFQVVPPDPHGFDGDGDGVGCES